MLYPQSFVDELRGRFLVSEVVGKQVHLKRHGHEFSGLCPFHKEKTPSFTVNDEKGFYHCFGCGVHGDTIGFVKEFQGISYREAIERLAAEAGMPLPQPSVEVAKKESERKGLQEVAEAACRWFEQELMSTAGHAARAYLAQRGLSEETISRFRIGFAPDANEALKRALLAQGITEVQMVAAGLLIAPEGRPPYSRFRGRVMFPIRDKASRVIAFGGRVLPGMGASDAPKYLNSPETELFKKGQLLYNYDLARRPAMEANTLLLCEGYMDVIALAQAGIGHAVAPLGTAITASQVQLLWQLCDTPTLCLDGDAAGARAMVRVSALVLPLLMPGKSLNFMTLPAGEDPDSLVRSRGVAALGELMKQAKGLAEVLWQQVMNDAPNTPEARAGQEQLLMQWCDQMQHPSVKSYYRQHFKQKLWEHGRTASAEPKGTRKHQKQVQPKAAAVVFPALPDPHDPSGKMERAVGQCLIVAWHCPQLLADAEREEFLACAAILSEPMQLLRQQALGGWVSDANEFTAGVIEALQKRLGWIMPRLQGDATEDQQQMVWGRLWDQSVMAYHKALLQQELAQAEADYALRANEAANARIMALREQMHQIEQEYARRQDQANAEMAEV